MSRGPAGFDSAVAPADPEPARRFDRPLALAGQAPKLFISTMTVDHHVSAVLAKVNAPTRNVAASYAARPGLAGRREYRERRGNLGSHSRSGTRASRHTVALKAHP